MHDQTLSQVRRSLAVFVATAGFLWGGAGALDWKGLNIFAYCLGGGLFPVVSDYMWYLWKQRKVRQFFGVTKANDTVSIVVASYQSVTDYDERDEAKKFRYKKKRNDQDIRVVGAHTFVVGLGTAKTATLSALNLGKLLGFKFTVSGDEEVQLHADDGAREGAKICLGSPTTNNQTLKVLEELSADVRIEFKTGELIYHPVKDHPHQLKPQNSNEEFAALIRLYEGKEKPISFVCAGVGEEGTVAITKYLIENWRLLPQSSFVRIYRCNLATSGIDKEPIYAIRRDAENAQWNRDV